MKPVLAAFLGMEALFSRNSRGASSAWSDYADRIEERLTPPPEPVLGDFEDATETVSEASRTLFNAPKGVIGRLGNLISPESIPNYGKQNFDFKFKDLKSWVDDFDKRNPSMTFSKLFSLSPRDIEKLPKDDRNGFQNLVLTLAEVKPDVILETFGESMLLFIYAHYPRSNTTRSKLERALTVTPFNNLRVLKAAQNSWRGRHFLKSLIRAYDILNGDELGVIQKALPHLLEKHKIVSDSNDTEDFSVEVVHPYPLITKGKKRGRPREYHGVDINDKHFFFFLDAPFGLVLKHGDEPAAVVSANISRDGNTLEIRQIQAISPYEIVNDSAYYKDENGQKVFHRRLRPSGIFDGRRLRYDFKKLLVEMAELWAQVNNFKEVMVLSGKHNYHVVPREDEDTPRLDEKRAIQIYDKTADAMGYKQKENGNWYKLVA